MRRNRRHPLSARRTRLLRALTVAVLLVAALAIRLEYNSATTYHAINDAGTYNRMASMVATHGDYHTGSGLRSGAGGSLGPTAYFPPAFPYLLAVSDLLTGHQAGGKAAVGPERTELALLGTISVALLGLVALEAFGEGAALAALVIGAVYPVFIELSGTLVAENLVVALELGALWAMLRARRAAGRRVWGWLAGAGVLTGLAALAHENAILDVIPFGIAAWGITRGTRSDRPSGPPRQARLRALLAPALLVVCTCAVIAPWTIRNAVELHAFVPIADETGITLAGTYNPVSANTPGLPYKWHLFSHVAPLHHFAHEALRLTEVQLSDKLQAQALSYIGAHPLAPLQASWDNTLRMFELEGSYAWQASAKALSIHRGVAQTGIIAFWVVCLLAIAGLFTRRARRGPWWLWAVPLLWWVSVVPINVETPRFREPIDPFLILLAACALATAASRLSGLGGTPVWRRRRASQLAVGETELVQMVQRLT